MQITGVSPTGMRVEISYKRIYLLLKVQLYPLTFITLGYSAAIRAALTTDQL